MPRAKVQLVKPRSARADAIESSIDARYWTARGKSWRRDAESRKVTYWTGSTTTGRPAIAASGTIAADDGLSTGAGSSVAAGAPRLAQPITAEIATASDVNFSVVCAFMGRLRET